MIWISGLAKNDQARVPIIKELLNKLPLEHKYTFFNLTHAHTLSLFKCQLFLLIANSFLYPHFVDDNLFTFRYATQQLFLLLYYIHKHSDKNLMTASNLAIVIGPNLLRDPHENSTVMNWKCSHSIHIFFLHSTSQSHLSFSQIQF
jgi:hypothetical protein